MKGDGLFHVLEGFLDRGTGCDAPGKIRGVCRIVVFALFNDDGEASEFMY